MTSVLVVYRTRSGHTARIARRLCEAIEAAGGKGEMMEVIEASREGVELERYDVVVLGAPVYYGTYDPCFMDFIEKNRSTLESMPHSFFNVSVTARTPVKATVEGNRYMQKFLELSPWTPNDLQVIAGKVDYPSWGFFDTLMIQLIMMMTKGPTNRKTVIDYTDWEAVAGYGRHVVGLAAGGTELSRARLADSA